MALDSGDMVLVRMKALGQDHKIADKWEQNPYVVKSQMAVILFSKCNLEMLKIKKELKSFTRTCSTQLKQPRMMNRIPSGVT